MLCLRLCLYLTEIKVPSEKRPISEVDEVLIKTNCEGGKLNLVPRFWGKN